MIYLEFEHDNKYLYKITNEDFDVSYSFTNNIATGDTLLSCTVTCTDSEATDATSTMISNTAISTPICTFHLAAGTADKTYQIKIVAETTNGDILVAYLTLDVFGTITINAKLGDSDANSYVILPEANKYIYSTRNHSSVWDKLSIEGKKRVLIQACRDIDRYTFVNPPYYDNQALSFPDDDHNVLTGDCATPFSLSGFSNSGFTSDTYGGERANTNYWKYGSIHITAATPLGEIRQIDTSNITTDVITVITDFSASPTTNSDFIAFEPLNDLIKNAQIEQALYILDNEGNKTITSYVGIGAQRVTIGDTSVWLKDNVSSTSVVISSKARKMLSRWIKKSNKVLRR